jgi:hypothetical protein
MFELSDQIYTHLKICTKIEDKYYFYTVSPLTIP